MRLTVQRVCSINKHRMQLRAIDSSCELYHADESTAAAHFAGNAPFWPFLWAGGWAVAAHLLSKHTGLADAKKGPVVALDVGSGGGICSLAALAAFSCDGSPPAMVVVANDIDEVALAATHINIFSTVQQDHDNYAWLKRLPAKAAKEALVKRLLLDNRNLLSMSGSELSVTLQGYALAAAAAAASVGSMDTAEASSSPSRHANPLPSLLVLVGDMMYDTETGKALLELMRKLLLLKDGAVDEATRRTAFGLPTQHGHVQLPLFRDVVVLVGDPGRHAFKQLVSVRAPGGGCAVISKPAVYQGASTPLPASGLQAHLVGEYSPPAGGQAHADNGLAATIEGLDGYESAAGGNIAVVQLQLP